MARICCSLDNDLSSSTSAYLINAEFTTLATEPCCVAQIAVADLRSPFDRFDLISSTNFTNFPFPCAARIAKNAQRLTLIQLTIKFE